METLEKYAVGADMTTYSAQVEVLRERFFLLQSELGKNLLPVVNWAIDQLNSLLKKFNQLNDGTKRFIAESLLWGTAVIVTFTIAVKGATAALTAWYGLKGLGIVMAHFTGEGNRLTKMFAGMTGIAGKLGGILSKLFSPAGLLGAVAVGILGVLAVGIHLLNKPIRELEKAYDQLGDTIREVNRNIFNLSSLRQMADDMGEQIDKIQKSGDRLKKSNAKLVEGLIEQKKFIDIMLGDDKASQKDALIDRIDKTKASMRELNRQFKLINTIRETGKERIKRFYELDLKMKKTASEASALQARLESLDKVTIRSKYEEDLVYAEWAIKRAQDVFSRTTGVDNIVPAASQLKKALAELRDLRLEDEKLSSAERIDLKQEFAYESGKIDIESRDKYIDIMQTLSKAWKSEHDKMADASKDAYKRITKDIKARSKEWSKAANAVVDEQMEAMKKLGDKVKEGKDKYSIDTFIENLFKPEVKMSSRGSIRRFGYYHEMMQVLDLKDVKEKAARAKEIFDRYQSLLVYGTEKTNKEIAEILEKWNNEIMDARVERWHEYQAYLKRIDAYTKFKAEQFIKTLEGVMNRAKGVGIAYAAAVKTTFHFPEFNRFLKNTQKVQKELDKSEKGHDNYAKKLERLYERLSKKLANTLIDFIFDKDRSFKDMAAEFVKSSLKIIAQHYIETEIRIMNERRVQAEVAKTQSIQMGGGGLLNSLFSAFKNPKGLLSSAGGAGVALGGASLLAPNELGNAASGIFEAFKNVGKKVETVPDKIFGVFDSPNNDRFAGLSGRHMARDISREQITKAATKSAHDQMNYFNNNFKDEFGKMLDSIPSGNSGERPVINVHVHTKIGRKEIVEIINEADYYEERNRLTRSGKR